MLKWTSQWTARYIRLKLCLLSATGSCGNCCGGRTRSLNNSHSENFAKIWQKNFIFSSTLFFIHEIFIIIEFLTNLDRKIYKKNLILILKKKMLGIITKYFSVSKQLFRLPEDFYDKIKNHLCMNLFHR